MSAKSYSYTIVPEIPQSYTSKLYEFIYKFFLFPQKDRFTDISQGTFFISYSVLDFSGNRRLRVQASGGEPMNLTITPLVDAVSEDEISKSKEDMDIAVDMFEDQVRKNSLFFAWEEGESIVPETVSGKKNNPSRVLLETQILFMTIFMTVGLVLFYFIGPLVAILLLAVQFIFVFYSNKIIARTADWRITDKNPFIHILQYPLSPGEDEPISKIPKNTLIQLKQQIYKETIAEKGELDCQKAHGIFSEFGIDCKEENFIARKVNVYDVVKRTADKFGFKVPETVVSNTLLPNAAASGVGPSRGTVMITTGTFVQLSDEEIVSVLGHEFGHLKGHDPLWLYGLSAVQYLFWFYVVFEWLQVGSLLLLIIYLWVLLTLTYFVSKFFEARADLTSAMVIGQPNVLAGSLEKIGFQRLLMERRPFFRFQEWLSFDPHPPIYFRISRLRKLNATTAAEIKHPLMKSAEDVTEGFLDSLS
jgi:heat shock protein HtpX